MKQNQYKLPKRFIPVVLVLIGVVAIGLGFAFGPKSERNSTGKLDTVSVGMESTAVNSLIYIAASQNYFAANGLNVTIKDYSSGLTAVNGLLSGEVDLATSSEFVIVGQALAREQVRTLSSIDKFRHNYLLARKDRGIEAVTGLAGKKVGLPLKTAAEFYLGRFLDLQGMHIKQVTLVDVSPPQLVEALVNGEVDAVIAWQPNAKAIEARLGNGLVKWPVQNEQATFCTVSSTEAWVTAHPELVERFLKALAQAEAYAINNPAETKAMLQKQLNYDDPYMATIWPEHQFSLTLDQTLVLAMEDEARWLINNNLTEAEQTPNFLDYLYLDGVKAVRPEAMNVIQ
ncbi:MAG: NrtA/SsuA/CpmA family ABC transporter substrate-binding protein [Anaerolineae bacterium]|nr:NrtA/SsuA/CpmA family ABC transporter substrate-binding protein [Anaerolineae bacterium]